MEQGRDDKFGNLLELMKSQEGVEEVVELLEANEEIEHRLSIYSRLNKAFRKEAVEVDEICDILDDAWFFSSGVGAIQAQGAQLLKSSDFADVIRAVASLKQSPDIPWIDGQMQTGFSELTEGSDRAHSMSVLLTGRFPDNFTEYKERNCQEFEEYFFDRNTYPGRAASYGERIVWAGNLAEEFRRRFEPTAQLPVEHPNWVVAGILWKFKDNYLDQNESDETKVMSSSSSSKGGFGNEELESSLQQAGNIVLQGPPGTGKTWAAREYVEELANSGGYEFVDCNWSRLRETEGRREIALNEATELPVVWEMVQMHPGYSYEDLVRGMGTDSNTEGISFEPKDQVVVELAEVARAREEAGCEGPVVLILDEINRCNLASVLGELILVLEEDKRSEAGEGGWPVRLQYPAPEGGGEVFTLPKSLKFIGTMNTADRSIAMIDYAIRRRFRFIDMVPDSNALQQAYGEPDGVHAQLAVNAFENLSAELKDDLPARLRIGHTYFILSPEDDESLEAWRERLAEKLLYEVVPLLREYRAEGRLDTSELSLGDSRTIDLEHPVSNDVQRRDRETIQNWLGALAEEVV